MLKIGIITPIKYLKEYSCRGHFYLALAHLIKPNSKVERFLKTQKDKDIILDNGAFELGYSLPMKDLLAIQGRIKANMIVLPDAPKDVKKTQQLMSSSTLEALEFNELLVDNGKEPLPLNFMGVPQGKTRDDWWKSFKQMYDNIRVSTLGISFQNVVFDTERLESSREDILNEMVQKGYTKKNIHLLGGGYNLYRDVVAGRSIPCVKSLDTCLPFLFGSNCVILDSKTIRKKGVKLNHDVPSLNELQKDFTSKNISTLLKWANLD